MNQRRKDIGLAIIGCGTIGRIRAMLAKDYPGIAWLGICDINENLGRKLVADTGAEFFTRDFGELLKRPEVNAAIIATDENRHVEFLTSYPPGDLYDGQLWGPMREETNAWFGRVRTGLSTPHASAADGPTGT